MYLISKYEKKKEKKKNLHIPYRTHCPFKVKSQEIF